MNVLIIDNEQHSRDVIMQLVNWNSYGIKEILEASNSLLAEKITIEKRPKLIFSDVERSGENGLLFLLWVSLNFPETLTIITTGHLELNVFRKIKNVVGVITKPLNKDELNKIIARALTEEKILPSKKKVGFGR